MSEKVYEELAAHLNEAYVGAPMSPAFMGIMKILYPGEEAEVALKMSIYENKTLAEYEELIPEKAGRMGELLDSMAQRGTVLTLQKPGRERIYRLLPSMVGFSEVPFLSGVDTPEKHELASLWKKYLEEEFAQELVRGVPLTRVVPIAESLEDKSQVLPYDAIAEMLDGITFMAVAHCPCRQIQKYTGEGCDHPIETCMHFGSLGQYLVETGKGRRINKDEALQILRSATEEGLIHVCDNVEGALHGICNCCPCCCPFFKLKSSRGLETYSRSNYVARVEADDCIGCGTCGERCPVDAITMIEDVAQVDMDACIGCGVCTPTCEGDVAIRLRQREETSPPPNLQEFIKARSINV